MKFANVIVDISHEKLDRPFGYIIPDELEKEITVGTAVTIPFGKGNRHIKGYVIEITDQPSFDISKMKEIMAVEEGAAKVESQLINLAYWIKENYGSTMNQALKTVIPVKNKIRNIEKKTIVLNLNSEQLEEKIKSITPNLPDNFQLNVNKSSSGSASDMFMNLRILGEDDIDYVRNIADSEIVPYLENIDGIANVTIMGGRQKSIEVIVDPERCKALNITTSTISRAISSNLAEKSFAGSVYENNKRYFVNVTAEYLATEDLGSCRWSDPIERHR